VRRAAGPARKVGGVETGLPAVPVTAEVGLG
jgi:hypothetical protein